MIVEINNDRLEISAPIGILFSSVVIYCAHFGLPLKIDYISNDSLNIDFAGWTDQLIYKYQYQTNKAYSELSELAKTFAMITKLILI